MSVRRPLWLVPLLLGLFIPCLVFWLLAAAVGWDWWRHGVPWHDSAAYEPRPLGGYSPPPSPSVPPRHPPVDSHPEGYEWVHGHQHGSAWVEGYWRRRPGYQPPLPTPATKPTTAAQ